MQNIILYAGVAVALFIFGYMFFSSPESVEVSTSQNASSISESKESRSESQNTKIVYEESKEPKREDRAEQNIEEAKEEVAKPQEESRIENIVASVEPSSSSSESKAQTLYTIIGSTANTQDYTISVVSNSQIVPKQGALPTLPAIIKGSIDGQQFTIPIPTNIQNSDLRVKVIDKQSGEEKIATVDLSTLQPGSSNILSMFYYDIESSHIMVDDVVDTQNLPPMPPM